MRNELHTICVALSALTMSALTLSCSEPTVPKPRGFFRITLPDHAYEVFDADSVPYTFEKSTHCAIRPDRSRGAESTWYNISYPSLNCKIHMTYLRVPKDSIDVMMEDSHRLAYKHTVMADAIGERTYEDDDHKVYATYYDIKGNAATPAQIAITDSLGQMLRGSVYFNCKPNKDSLAPVIGYVCEDLNHIIESFRWK